MQGRQDSVSAVGVHAPADLLMDEAQRVVEQLEREGKRVEAHADGLGSVSVSLIRKSSGRPRLCGRGPSFRAASYHSSRRCDVSAAVEKHGDSASEGYAQSRLSV